MRDWELASLVFFGGLAGAALAASRLPRRVRLSALAGSTLGIASSLISSRVPYALLVHTWLLPPALLLLGYWTSGLLFVAPIDWQERALLEGDRRLRITALARAVPGWLAALLELAYAGVYPLIPVALIVHLQWSPAPDPARFWTVILVTDYICFAFMAVVQTRPPRALEPAPPWSVPARRLNIGLLGATSIQVNTFPSGHAAEALAAMLLVLDAPWPAVASMALAALAVAAGAVLGRYHFAADAIAGWIVALAVWRHVS
ncbi:MAG TPA: phosphatase PAP2 family protein [Vicinamibacterales bacterium]|nr:phosphatase PAP2 family protein [Vicinamibacterales bacterium]